MLEKDVLSFRRRFVKDFNLPINLIDSPYFEYYMDRYDFFPKEDWNMCVDKIDKHYDGNVGKWLESYSQLRDDIITTVENSASFSAFNSADMKNWKMPVFSVGDLNIYNSSNTGKKFISIDLKKANFQALRKFNPEIVMNCDTYDDFIEYFHGDEYFKKSKYTRQVIFGKLNPRRTITFEKYLIGTIFSNENNHLFKYLYENTELITVKSDEIVFMIDNPEMVEKLNKTFLQSLRDVIKKNNDLDVTVEAFHLSRIICENHNGNTVDGYIREFYLDGRTDLKNVSSIFLPQVYAFTKGLPLTENDLYFRAEDQTAKFCNQLKLIEIQR